MLTREEFLRPAARKVQKVTLCDGRELCIRSLTEGEHAEYEASVWRPNKQGVLEMDPDLLQAQRRLLVAMCVCDESGRPLLTPEDLDALGELDGRMMRELAVACRKLAGLDQTDDSEKNSG